VAAETPFAADERLQTSGVVMDRNLALEFVRVTEAAAIMSARTMGRGDANLSDQAAVSAMRTAFNSIEMDGLVVIGEGERDEAPLLFIGESPHGRMMSWISSTLSFTICCGVLALAKSKGVTSFTFLSVHWALRSTATNRV
jgi:hypothetical protein